MTSARPPTRSGSTSATCAASPRRAASRACCTPCAGSATSCEPTDVALRGRLTLMSALIVGVTLVLAAVIAYSVVRGQIRGQVDAALRAQAGLYQRRAARLSGTIPEPSQVPIPPPQLGGPGGYVQAVGGDGTVVPLFDPAAAGVSIPVTDAARAIARAGDGEQLTDAQAGATHLRVL